MNWTLKAKHEPVEGRQISAVGTSRKLPVRTLVMSIHPSTPPMP